MGDQELEQDHRDSEPAGDQRHGEQPRTAQLQSVMVRGRGRACSPRSELMDERSVGAAQRRQVGCPRDLVGGGVQHPGRSLGPSGVAGDRGARLAEPAQELADHFAVGAEHGIANAGIQQHGSGLGGASVHLQAPVELHGEAALAGQRPDGLLAA
jgi:hypothetical protein